MSCRDYNCYWNCCNYYGYCPTYSRDCYYYYSDPAITAGAIIGIVLGIIVFIFIIVLIIWCCRRYRERHYSQPPPPPVTNNEIYMVPMQPPYEGGYGQPNYPPPAAGPQYYGQPGNGGYGPNQPYGY